MILFNNGVQMKKLFGFILTLLIISNCNLKAQVWEQTHFPTFFNGFSWILNVSPNGNVLLVADGYGQSTTFFVQSSNNGESWTTISNDIQLGVPYIVSDSLGNMLMVDLYDYYRSTNHGGSWIQEGPNYNLRIPWRLTSTSKYFFGIYTDTLVYSSDLGKTWNYYCNLPFTIGPNSNYGDCEKILITEKNGNVNKIYAYCTT